MWLDRTRADEVCRAKHDAGGEQGTFTSGFSACSFGTARSTLCNESVTTEAHRATETLERSASRDEP